MSVSKEILLATLKKARKTADVRYGVTLEKLATATEGYAHSYVVKQNGEQVGATIDIPKDFLVKSGEVKTVVTADTPVSGYTVGQKYLDFVVNSVNGDAGDQHIYLSVDELVDVYKAGNGLVLGADNTFAVKINSGSANGLSADANGLAMALATADSDNGQGGTTPGTAGAMSGTDKTRIDTLWAEKDETISDAEIASIFVDD